MPSGPLVLLSSGNGLGESYRLRKNIVLVSIELTTVGPPLSQIRAAGTPVTGTGLTSHTYCGPSHR